MTYIELWFKKNQGSLLDKVISFRTNSEFTHVELVFVLDTGPKEGEPYLAYTADGSRGGIIEHTLIWDPKKWTRVRLLELNSLNPRFNKVLEFIENNRSGVYDYFSLWSILIGKRGTDEKAFNCAQYCCAALQAANMFLFADLELVTPANLYYMARTRSEFYENIKLECEELGEDPDEES